MKRLALFTCFVFAWLPARAQETWVCAYTWSSADQTVIRKFQVNGDDLIDSSQDAGNPFEKPEKFTILQNNEFGIVAAQSFAEMERYYVEPAIGAYVVLINKQNGKFQQSNAILGEPKAVTGTCTR
jgi:hypothetical protein